MFAMPLPEPELAAQGARIELKFHILTLASVAVTRLPRHIVALVADSGEIFDFFRATADGDGTTNPVADSSVGFAEERFIYGTSIF